MPDHPPFDPAAIQQHVAADMGREADAIMRSGTYRSRSGRYVSIQDSIRRSVRGTVYYQPDSSIEPGPPQEHETIVEVRNESTTAAARRLLRDDLYPVALNFASGTRPGGGYEAGARAQEESLARSSALVACLQNAAEFYALHRELNDPLFSDAMIYSPDVPFFRGRDHQLLDEPYHLSVITAAAPRADYLDGRGEEIIAAFERRIRRIFEIARENEHDSLVLGAWGCGAYRNDPLLVAELFRESIEEHALGAFRHIAFAILDHTDERRFIAPFDRALEPLQNSPTS
ncbi:MAG: TIGR02452 family protein [Acidobacteria bacterium]|nr:TIGR02452 family protein [Acidobacteriota bacterium]